MDTASRVELLLERFRELSAVPRGSGREAAARDWVVAWARSRKLETRRDRAGNLLVRVSARGSRPDAPPVILQGHLDMVCEKRPDSRHDFTRQGIELVREDGWLRARDTTLGADNGIGVCLALVAAEDPELRHPPLELLFTVEEETGLRGAAALESGFLRGRTLLNLDSEEPGTLTVGCAGGRDTVIAFPAEAAPSPPATKPFRIRVGGLLGGHSGADIHLGRGNAILALARALKAVEARSPLRIADIAGGSARNAIPRDASALLRLHDAEAQAARGVVEAMAAELRELYGAAEPKLELDFAPGADAPATTISAERSGALVRLLGSLPNGLHSLSRDFPGVVETSNNIGVLSLSEGRVEIVSSQRSSSAASLREITERVETVAALAGATASSGDGYPPWQPELGSPLLERCRSVWRARHGADPVVKIIHAGLECAVIGARYPGMDMVSFGPTITGAHSPDERLELRSLDAVWELLSGVLAALAS